MESLRILGILLHKCWLVRKRHWIKILLGQILLPTGFVICAWVLFVSDSPSPDKFETDTHNEMVPSEKLIDDFIKPYSENVSVIYSPNNTFVDELMMKFHECFKNKTVMLKFNTESDVVDYYHKNSYRYNSVSVIFDQSVDNTTKHLHFKLQVMYLPNNKLYYPSSKPSFSYLRNSPFVQIQICLSESFVRIKSTESSESIPQTFIQEGPYPVHVEKPKIVTFTPVCHFLLTVGLMIPAFVETLKAMNEKFVGINVLMSMNGIPSTLNLLSWMISGLLLSSVVGAISTFLMSFSYHKNVLAFASNSNPYIIFLVLIFHMVHTIAFDLHISTYVPKALIALPVISLINVFAMVIHIYVIKGNSFVEPYVGIIFPIILLYQATGQVYSHERKAESLQWKNLFENENHMIGIESSNGMVIVLSAMGMIFHFVLAIYAQAINPGKYGVGHHLLFFLKSGYNHEDDENIKDLVYNNVEDKYFEPTFAEACTPGIQIRNLKKSFSIGLFNKEKVHALTGVSIDFYKGQITSLLGHNGAGKTTLMSILTRITSATDGSIFIKSKNLKGNACEILKDVGLCAQEDMHFASLTVSEQLEFFAMVQRKNESRSTIKEKIENLIQNLKLFSVKDALPNDLSGDQKRKLSLAMALVGDPSILILDEPTSGLDPYSKRTVWDVLLKIKDHKTILMSTHDMEEADILGDRIAVLHNGQIKSYGTPLFLKKMIGGENSIQVTLSIERWSNIDRILKELQHETALVKKEFGEIILSVPTLTLSEWLKTLEEKKKALDISKYSLAHVSLERVFLKLTEENVDLWKSHCAATNDEEKLKGLAQHLQSVKALLLKKLTYTLKDTTIILMQTLLVLITFLAVAIIRITPEQQDQSILPINLNMYDNPRTLYANFNTTLGDQYDSVSRSLGGNPEHTTYNLDDELLKWAKSDLAGYVKHMIAAAEFNGTRANAFYSERATHSLPISINLLWNAIIRNILGPEYSISLSSQKLPDVHFSSDFFWVMNLSTLSTGVIVILFSFVIAMFVVHPSRERSQGIKHLQKMTGVSGFVYWGTMLLFDLMVYTFFVFLLIVLGFVCADRSMRMYLYDTDEIMVIVLLLILFGVNMLPLIYAFSFIETKTKNLIKLLGFASIILVLFGLPCIFYNMSFAMIEITDKDELIMLDTILTMLFLLPHVSFIKGHRVAYLIRAMPARCKRLPNIFYDSVCADKMDWDYCCKLNCYDGKCLKPESYFEEGVFSVKESVTYLCATPILYFSILVVLECRLFLRIMVKFKRHEAAKSSGDEEVQCEKAIILQQIQKSSNSSDQKSTTYTDNSSNSSSNYDLLVYELRKNYKKTKAVVDVSFGVERGECFGLFGVNQAGKSTLLKMMAGVEIPDYGKIYVGDKVLKHNKKSIGYCPQHDATLKCLNAYDHLRLFARLRGIPENQVENEVQAWIGQLNLTACASLPSCTYSIGNKQRLNVAIALVGNPKLVLLDEPTTRMDPGARRALWNTIKYCQKAGQTFLLASHNMDECTAVCNRMAIMTDGKLTCIGTPKELKQRFGAGYDVQIRMDPTKVSSQLNQVKSDMRLLLHCLLINENLGYLMYSVSGPGTSWKKVYEVMNKIKSKYDCIDDFLVIVRLST